MRILSVGLCLALSIVALSLVIEHNDVNPNLISYDDMLPKAKTQIDCLAKNVYYEAGNQSDEGKIAVAMVTLNRVHSKNFAGSVCKVVNEKYGKVCQFSWLCENKSKVVDRSTYKRAKAIALYAYVNYDKIDDVTNGATYYHATYVKPKWSNLKQTVKIGDHIFYKPKKEVNQHDEKSQYSAWKQFGRKQQFLFTSNGRYLVSLL